MIQGTAMCRDKHLAGCRVNLGAPQKRTRFALIRIVIRMHVTRHRVDAIKPTGQNAECNIGKVVQRMLVHDVSAINRTDYDGKNDYNECIVLIAIASSTVRRHNKYEHTLRIAVTTA